jgi:hypothetical protein
MDDTITISKATLVKLVGSFISASRGSAGNPNPDDPGNSGGPFGSFGPGGPVLRDLLSSNLVRIAGDPDPFPLRAVLDARAVIDRAFSQFQLAEMLGGLEQSKTIMASTRSQIQEFVDDYCGTGRPRWPRPRRLDITVLQPIELVAAGVQFQKIADLAMDNPLREDLLAAADKLFEVGLSRLE